MTSVRMNPYELDVVHIADSNFRNKLSFVVPDISSSGLHLDDDMFKEEFAKQLDSIEILKKFSELLGLKSVADVSYILQDSSRLMELAEYACIFERVTADMDDPVIVLRDGLLRSKFLKDFLIKKLIRVLHEKKGHVKLVGVAKTSAILSLLSVAIFCEKIIPPEAVGYIKIPLYLELQAYTWSGSGKVDPLNAKHLDYAFGELYIVKLCKNSNLLVTLEVPYDWDADNPVYTQEEVEEIISYLAKDSKLSYPDIGYPQTIMRAHEAAARLGFPASIMRDEIRDKILSAVDKDTKGFLRDGWLLMDTVDKGVLGGGKYE